jgi:RhoGAP domain
MNVVSACISHISSDKYMYERNLFRATASLTEVRQLRNTLYQQGSGGLLQSLSMAPVSLVVGVLTSSLQSMPVPLFHDVYDNIVAMDITEDYSQCKSLICSWLVQLHAREFEMVSEKAHLIDSRLPLDC